MNMSLPPDVLNVIGKALNDDIDNYNLDLHRGNKKGTGYLGEIIFVSVINKTTKEETHLVIKKVINLSRSLGKIIKASFKNEIFFYENFLKSYLEFQKSSPLTDIFDNFAKCYTTCDDENEEKIVLENLQNSNYKMMQENVAVDAEHMELIFKNYGRFHGISFAYRETNSEEYKKMGTSLVDVMQLGLADVFPDFTKIMTGYLMIRGCTLDTEVMETYKKYAEKGKELFEQAIKYDGDNAIILHGDCHNLNMLFKYDENNKPVDLKLIDFQLSKLGTPVSDLSYCIYASANPEIFNNIDHYLNIYYDSLTETLKEFDLDANKIYPLNSLKEEWKTNAKFGLIMSSYVWMGRTSQEKIDLADLDEWRNKLPEEQREGLQRQKSPFLISAYVKIFDSLMLHGHEYGVL